MIYNEAFFSCIYILRIKSRVFVWANSHVQLPPVLQRYIAQKFHLVELLVDSSWKHLFVLVKVHFGAPVLCRSDEPSLFRYGILKGYGTLASLMVLVQHHWFLVSTATL